MFQVIQNSLAGVQIRYVRAVDGQEIETGYFHRKIRDVFGSEFKVEFVEVDLIEPEQNGKFRIVVSSVGGLLDDAEKSMEITE